MLFSVEISAPGEVKQTSVYAIDHADAETTLFLIHDNEKWVWVDANKCKPVTVERIAPSRLNLHPAIARIVEENIKKEYGSRSDSKSKNPFIATPSCSKNENPFITTSDK